MTLRKNNETFAQTAKRLSKEERDPDLLTGLLEELKNEQEQYKQENNIGDYSQQDQGMQFAYGGYGDAVNVSGDYTNPMTPTTASQLGYYNFNYNSPLGQPIGLGMSTPREMPGTFDNLGLKASAAIGSAKGGIGDFMNSPGGAMAGQALMSGASALMNKYGNKQLRQKAEQYARQFRNNANKVRFDAVTQAPVYTSFEDERNQAKRGYRDYLSTLQGRVKEGARSRGEYLANVVSGASEGSKALSSQLGSSIQKERTLNANEAKRVNAANAAALMQVQQQRAAQQRYADQLYSQWMQQAMAYEGAEKQAPVGFLSDMNKSMAQNRMIGAMGNNYGYIPTFSGGRYEYRD